MPTDQTLFIECALTLNHMPKARAAEYLAAKYGLSYDSVRGRLSRANTPMNRAAVVRELAKKTYEQNPSIVRQLSVIQKSEEQFNTWNKGIKKGIFVSDVHLPNPRWDAYELFLKIAQDYQPDLVTGFNDALDNTGYGRWEDDRPIRAKVWDSDITNVRSMEQAHYSAIKSILNHNGIIVGVNGNHDNWWYSYKRRVDERGAEAEIADYMEMLYNTGVLQFSRGHKENFVRLNPALVLWHGQFVSKSAYTNAKSTLDQFMLNGVASSVIVGHTHRPSIVNGSEVGYNGVKFVNNGALTDYAPYMRRNPVAWGLGITLFRWDTESRDHGFDLLQFTERGAYLTCRYADKEYSVKLQVDE